MKTVKLCKGPGVEGQSHCAMVAASLVNGDGFTDFPECASATISSFVIALNDLCETDEERERRMSPFVWAVIGTRADAEMERLLYHEIAENLESNVLPAVLGPAIHHLGDILYREITSRDLYRVHRENIDPRSRMLITSAAELILLTHIQLIGRQKVLDFWCEYVLNKLIPIVSTTPVEPGMGSEKLHTEEAPVPACIEAP